MDSEICAFASPQRRALIRHALSLRARYRLALECFKDAKITNGRFDRNYERVITMVLFIKFKTVE